MPGQQPREEKSEKLLFHSAKSLDSNQSNEIRLSLESATKTLEVSLSLSLPLSSTPLISVPVEDRHNAYRN